MKTIYLAGGCFWGVEHYFKLIRGVIKTEVGYANGNKQNPSYEEVCGQEAHFVEAVKVDYDEDVILLNDLLDAYYKVINPTSINKQGNDIGEQYRTGIYYINPTDLKVIGPSIINLQKAYEHKIVVEVLPLENFYLAESYHQDYLDKNPGGYCHINLSLFDYAREFNPEYVKPNNEELKKVLTALQFHVTQEKGTEKPYENAFDNHFEEGIYVDIVTKEPLFSSKDKFNSGCGWPAFSKAINETNVKENMDSSHGMHRQEVISRQGQSHLGHVFEDGPNELGGRRYCINSAALKFISKDQMEENGYGDLLNIF